MILKQNSKIPLDRFIHKALYEKNKGYYMNNNPFGIEGDFITSPNISIMFSEMISIWLISFWEKIGRPKNINIIEHGYICETRVHGVSKTSTNVLQLISRGIPYIKAANQCRKASK